MSPQRIEADVVVVGGGLAGLSSAVHLARRGLKTVVLEAQYSGRHASGVNAGGVRTLGRHVAEIPLSLVARDEYWVDMPGFFGADCGFEASGQLKVAETEADMAAARKRVGELQALGFHHEVLIDQTAVRELVPSMSPHVLGGIWAKEDGHANPYRTVLAMLGAARRQGVQVFEGQKVEKIEPLGDRWVAQAGGVICSATHVVNCAGAWAGEFARQLGEPVPVQPTGLMLMITQKIAPFVDPVLGAMGRPLSFKQFENGSVLIGGALRCEANPGERLADVDVARLYNSAVTVTDLFPHLKTLPVNRTWAGVEGVMPDNIPVLGHSGRASNVVHAFGFSAHGFEMSPVVGRIVSELVVDRRSSLPIDAFAIGRFQGSPA